MELVSSAVVEVGYAVEVIGVLSSGVGAVAEGGGLVVVGVAYGESYGEVVVGSESVLHPRLEAVGFDLYSVYAVLWGVVEGCLSAEALFVEGFEDDVEGVSVSVSIPAVEEVELFGAWFVAEAVVVVVHVRQVVGEVEHDVGTDLWAYFDIGGGVGFYFAGS